MDKKEFSLKDFEKLAAEQKAQENNEINNLSQREREKRHISSLDYFAHHDDGMGFKRLVLEESAQYAAPGERFTFFWSTQSPFSQWYKCEFKAERILDAPEWLDEFGKDISFSSTEQFMMYHKCLLCLDFDAAQKVLNTRDPKKQKEIGRALQMNEQDSGTWEYYKTQVVYKGNLAKFSQNEDLKEILLATKGTTLVEAAPNDPIWGIGLSETDPLSLKRQTWRGENLLGFILTKIRVDITGEY